MRNLYSTFRQAFFDSAVCILKSLLLLSLFLSSNMASADIFDKLESAKDCVQTNSCEKNKWLGKAMAVKKCQQEGNCVDKINEYAEKNKDKIKAGVDRVAYVNKCMNTVDREEQKQCYESAKGYYRKRAAAKQEKEAQNMYKNIEARSCFDVKKVAVNLITLNIVESCNIDNFEAVKDIRNTVMESANSAVKAMWVSCAQRCSQYDPITKTSQPIPGCPDELAQRTVQDALNEIPVRDVCRRYR